MKILFLIILLALIYGGVFFFTGKYYESVEKPFLKKTKLRILGFLALLSLVSLTKLMALFGIYTATIFVQITYDATEFPVEINGKKAKLDKTMGMGQVNVSSFFTKVIYCSPDGEKNERLGFGTFILNSSKNQDVVIREKRYRSISGDFSNMGNERFQEKIKAGTSLKLESKPQKCIILPPGYGVPKYVKAQFKGKRIFETYYD